MQGFSLDPIPPAGSSTMPTWPATPTILAIDTTTASCSAALLHAGRCEQVLEPLGPSHSRRALAMVADLLALHALRPADLDAIGFGAGPGSFTGLRVACGIAQGLGFGWRLPVVAIDSMATLASQAARTDGPEWVLVAIDARMGEVYRSVWRRSGTRMEPVLPAAAVTPARAADDFDRQIRAAPRAVAAGDGFVAAGALADWVAAAGGRVRLPAGARHPEAAAVARLAAQAFAAGAAVAPEDAAPVYVRDKVALDVGEQAALRARRAGAGPG